MSRARNPLALAALAFVFYAATTTAFILAPGQRARDDLDERYTRAWMRWHDGLPMRDCDAEALADMQARARRAP